MRLCRCMHQIRYSIYAMHRPGMPCTASPCPTPPTVGAGFHFSRASYVLSLLRPQVMQDLQLKVVMLLCAHTCMQP